MNLIEFLKNNIVLLDGATGSLLQKRGMPVGVRPEIWGIENQDVIVGIHKEYFDAGSNVVSSNTFGATILNFNEEKLEFIIKEAINNVKKAAQLSIGSQEKFVGFSVGPTGKQIEPYGDLSFEDCINIYKKSFALAEKFGADVIQIETFNDCYETKAAVLAAKESTSLPVFVTNAYSDNDRLLSGTTPESMVAMLEGLNVDALGLNCSYGPEKLAPVIKRILKVASLPVIFKPNAGIPHAENGITVFDVKPFDFSKTCYELVKEGVAIVGGCCGTSPEYISELSRKVSGLGQYDFNDKGITVVSSVNDAVVFGNKPIIIGERINPTGKKLIKEALKLNNIDYLLQEGISQKSKGADILDVNCGLPDIDETTMLPNVVKKLMNVVDLPLQIDTSDISAMEKALRIYNGKPVINSVNGKEESMRSVFPLAKKYGGVVICLTLDENGIPESAEKRLDIANNIIKTAEEYGISKKDLIFDTLALTISADDNAAKTTIDSIKLIKIETGCNTVLGVSNVSFGLPERDYINSTFMTCAFFNGLSSAIINPCSEIMMKAYRSYCALSGFDKSCQSYISGAGDTKISVQTTNNNNDLFSAIRDGISHLSETLTAEMLKTNDSLTIINEHIIPALDCVGKNFENKVVYLPQLLLSADAARSSFNVIKRSSISSENTNGNTIILATVKGDVHDIGKNIVRLLLENYGYNVIDLGKDVSPETILECVKKNNVKLVGLSALMTTTVPAMEETIKLIKKDFPDCKVCVGGAVLTEDYANKIGADKYSSDAMETVRYAETVFKK